jgi:hypothetical protein
LVDPLTWLAKAIHFAGLLNRELDGQSIEVMSIRLCSCIGRIEQVQLGIVLGPVAVMGVVVDAGDNGPYLLM